MAKRQSFSTGFRVSILAVRHEITISEGLLFKQDHVAILTSVRWNILHMFCGAHRDAELPSNTLVTVCSGQGLTAKLRIGHLQELHYLCITCPATSSEHWSLIQCLLYPNNWSFMIRTCLHSTSFNWDAYLVTGEHYSGYLEPDRLPSFQASSVVQATKQHFVNMAYLIPSLRTVDVIYIRGIQSIWREL